MFTNLNFIYFAADPLEQFMLPTKTLWFLIFCKADQPILSFICGTTEWLQPSLVFFCLIFIGCFMYIFFLVNGHNALNDTIISEKPATTKNSFFSNYWYKQAYLAIYKSKSLPTRISNLAALTVFSFVKKLSSDNINIKTNIYFPVIFFFFVFILAANLLGMLPWSFTITSSYIVVFQICLALFIGINLIGAFTHNIKFFNLFLPSGVPSPIIPFLVLIELLSYVSRLLSLSIRLFANMMAGHSLVKILVTSAVGLISSINIWIFPFAVLVSIILLPLIFLELAVAGLQAYVFTILVCVYLNDVINLH